MRLASYYLTGEVRANALFVSTLQRSERPTAGQIRQAIATTVHACGGQGCAEQVAQEFGDHPETAVVRMRWARAAAKEAFGTARPTQNNSQEGWDPPVRGSRTRRLAVTPW